MVVLLFLAVPCVCLRFVIVVFPDHTHLLFLINPDQRITCYRKVCIVLHSIKGLTNLSRVEFPFLINWTSPFPFKGLLGRYFYIYSVSKMLRC